MTFDLPLRNSLVRVAVSDGLWSTWTIIAATASIRLGAEKLDVIGPRILDRLRRPHDSAGSIDGKAVHWVCSFAENHHTVYCTSSQSRRELFFQDAGGRVVWRDVLSVADLERWSKALVAG